MLLGRGAYRVNHERVYRLYGVERLALHLTEWQQRRRPYVSFLRGRAGTARAVEYEFYL